MAITSFIDRFLSDKILRQSDRTLLLRSRVTVAVGLLLGLSLALMAMIFAVVGVLDIIVFWAPGIGSTLSSCAYALQLSYFKRTGNLFISANMIIATLFTSTIVFCFLTGGWSSAVMVVFFCALMCAFIMAGKQSGIFWGWATAITYVVFLFLHLNDVSMMQVFDISLLEYLKYCAWLFTWVVIFGGITLYGNVSRTLSESLMKERDRLQLKATYDVVTGAYNRQAFYNLLVDIIADSHRHNSSFLYLDVEIITNDFLPRKQEELMIRNIVKFIRDANPEGSMIARSGAFSFLVTINDVDGPVNAEEVTMSLYSLLEKELEKSVFSINIGAVLVPQYSDDIDDIVYGARKAVQGAKEAAIGFLVYSQQGNKGINQDRLQRGEWLRVSFNQLTERNDTVSS